MTNIRALLLGTLTLACALASAQDQTLMQFLRAAVEADPQHRAAGARLNASRLTYDAARSGYNTVLEIAPGVGFTNSNFVLGQRLDFSGSRAAQARIAHGLFLSSEAELMLTRALTVEQALNALADLWWSESLVVSRREAVRVAEATLNGVAKRVEIGEAPEVQRIRAGIEVDRAKQSLTTAESQLAQAVAALRSIGAAPVVARQAIAATVPTLDLAIQGALANRPETAGAQASIRSAEGEIRLALAAGRPDVMFGVAADVWSLDRDPFDRNGIGLQLSFSMPLFDRGEVRKSVAAARARTESERAKLDVVQRRVRLEVEQSLAALESTRFVSQEYETKLLPQARDLVQRYSAGLDAGLVDFLEVLEAQRTLSQIETEAADARRAYDLAQIAFLAAIGGLTDLLGTQE